jgi:hypothetical protein
MTALIFFGTSLTIIILIVRLILKLLQHKSIFQTSRLIAILILSYSLLWIFFYIISTYKTVPSGTDICFDDWCATVTGFEILKPPGSDFPGVKPNGQFVILYIKMSNHARGIAQKPSEPRINIIDEKGKSWSYSPEGQQALENIEGKQIPIDSRLELHLSLETRLVFDVPVYSGQLKALIEEGPFITRLLFYENKQVFLL